MVKSFFKEAFKNKMHMNHSSGSNKRPPSITDIFDQFSDFVEEARKEWFDEPYQKAPHRQRREQEQQENKQAQPLAVSNEVELLKQQVQILQQQLADKDEIISLLKSQLATEKAVNAAPAAKPAPKPKVSRSATAKKAPSRKTGATAKTALKKDSDK
jgi:hypothetical protein